MNNWRGSLRDVLRAHNRSTYDRTKRVNDSTVHERALILTRAFKTLRVLGFKIQDVHNLKPKHVDALVAYWVAKEYSPATLQKYISVLRVFAGWVGKAGMIGNSVTLVDDPSVVKRSYTAKQDKSWAGRVDVDAVIDAVTAENARVGMMLALQRAYGLRMKEACLLRPHLADNGSFLAVNWGTKGSRDRVVPIDNDVKRAVLDRAKAMLPRRQACLVPDAKTWPQWRSHVYYVLRKHGVTREEGITSHGLRHEYLNDLYEAKSGGKSPVRGGGSADAETALMARHVVAEQAGHCRPQIASAYIGSYKKRDGE